MRTGSSNIIVACEKVRLESHTQADKEVAVFKFMSVLFLQLSHYLVHRGPL